jgi:HAD superfamily hydrolase (TIGR01450 family)
MFKKAKLFVVDLDGTLWLGSTVLPGAWTLIDTLQKKGKVIFFTNTSTQTSWQIYKKLISLGFNCELEDVYTSSSLTAIYLFENKINNVYIIGSKALETEINSAGVKILRDETAMNLVVGLDVNFNYKKITTALNILLNDGKFIVCNKDKCFPIENGKFLPGCGSIVSSITTASDREPDFIVGKPNPYLLSKLSKKYNMHKSQIVVIGDSYESDFQLALNFGCSYIIIGKNNFQYKNGIEVTNLTEILHEHIRI